MSDDVAMPRHVGKYRGTELWCIGVLGLVFTPGGRFVSCHIAHERRKGMSTGGVLDGVQLASRRYDRKRSRGRKSMPRRVVRTAVERIVDPLAATRRVLAARIAARRSP